MNTSGRNAGNAALRCFGKVPAGRAKAQLKKTVWICKKCGFERFTKDTLEKAISKLERRHDG